MKKFLKNNHLTLIIVGFAVSIGATLIEDVVLNNSIYIIGFITMVAAVVGKHYEGKENRDVK